MDKKFQRRVEDFTCEHCSGKVEGNGYTNHCPKCLWSKHVDVNPGDRAASCNGMMKPMRIESEKGKQFIVQVCGRCSFMRRNEVQKQDDFAAVLEVAKQADF